MEDVNNNTGSQNRDTILRRIFRGIIIVIFEMIFIWTVFLILGLQTVEKVSASKEFPLENAGYLILGVVGVVAIYYLNKRFGHKIEAFLRKHTRVLLLISIGFLLFWQLYTCYGGYFISGWDAGIIQDTTLSEFYKAYDKINSGYFSWFPNNILIVWVFAKVTEFANFCGLEHLEYAPVIFQCILDALTVWLVYLVTYGFTDNYRISWLTYVIAYLFAGMSPWFMVAYSDATGIIFPILMLWLYQRARRSRKRWAALFFSLLLGMTGIAGYHIKPQCVIMLMAIVIIDIIYCFGRNFRGEIYHFFARLAAYAMGIGIIALVYNSAIIPSLHIEINSDTTIGWQHYFMMGLNEQSDGVYAVEDYQFTKSFVANAERNTADLEEAGKRIKAYGFKGLIRHLSRKELVNYGDGTFAWGVEGGSFSGDPEWATNLSSGLVRSYIKPEGKHYREFISNKQFLWVIIIVLQLFVVFFNKNSLGSDNDRSVLAMITSVIGITIFELLFEARARYLFCFTPVYVILAVWGLRNLFHIIRNHWH